MTSFVRGCSRLCSRERRGRRLCIIQPLWRCPTHLERVAEPRSIIGVSPSRWPLAGRHHPASAVRTLADPPQPRGAPACRSRTTRPFPHVPAPPVGTDGAEFVAQPRTDPRLGPRPCTGGVRGPGGTALEGEAVEPPRRREAPEASLSGPGHGRTRHLEPSGVDIAEVPGPGRAPTGQSERRQPGADM